MVAILKLNHHDDQSVAMTLRSLSLARLILTTLILVATSVPYLAAHAVLFEATPARNSTIVGRFLEVKLRFNVRVDASRSRLALLYPDGSLRVLQVKSEQSADVLAADASDLASGKYDLKWQVLAADGHITQGEIPFAVK